MPRRRSRLPPPPSDRNEVFAAFIRQELADTEAKNEAFVDRALRIQQGTGLMMGVVVTALGLLTSAGHPPGPVALIAASLSLVAMVF